jgi:hypothetical protein
LGISHPFPSKHHYAWFATDWRSKTLQRILITVTGSSPNHSPSNHSTFSQTQNNVTFPLRMRYMYALIIAATTARVRPTMWP